MIYSFIEKNIVLSSILLFLIIFYFLYYTKPKYLFNDDNSLKDFGIGYKNKTVFPLWVFAIVLGIISYLSILFYVKETKKIYY
jgi:hypothetical protein